MTISAFVSENFHIVNNPTHKIEETELFVLADIHVPPFSIVHNIFIDMFAQDTSKIYIESHEKGQIVDQNSADSTFFLKNKYTVIGWDTRGFGLKEIESKYTPKTKELAEKNRELQKKYFDMEPQHFTTQFDQSIADIREALSPESIIEFSQYGIETFEEGSTALSNMITTYKNTKNCFDFLIVGAFHIKGLVKESFGLPTVDIDAIATKARVTVLSTKLLQGIIPQQADKEKMGYLIQSSKVISGALETARAVLRPFNSEKKPS